MTVIYPTRKLRVFRRPGGGLAAEPDAGQCTTAPPSLLLHGLQIFTHLRLLATL